MSIIPSYYQKVLGQHSPDKVTFVIKNMAWGQDETCEIESDNMHLCKTCQDVMDFRNNMARLLGSRFHERDFIRTYLEQARDTMNTYPPSRDSILAISLYGATALHLSKIGLQNGDVVIIENLRTGFAIRPYFKDIDPRYI